MTQFSNKKYDLEERTEKFGEAVIEFSKTVPLNAITTPIVSQLVRSATSMGANYMEANCASSRKDFRNKIFICKKETQETKHWLRMLAGAVPGKKGEIRTLWKECHELNLIFQKITSSMDKQV